MTEFEEYQKHIQHTHNAFCRIVIRHASIDAARKALFLSFYRLAALLACDWLSIFVNLFRKSLSLRLTKTDRVDARTIVAMLMSGVVNKSYTETSYHNEELKSLTRYRFSKVRERAKLKQSIRNRGMAVCIYWFVTL